jgi:hypothetical protein
MFFKKFRPHSDGRLRKVEGVKVRQLLDGDTLTAVESGRGAVFNKSGEVVPLDYRTTSERLQLRFF